MRAAGYIRVSTDEQVKHGWNLGADRKRIEAECGANGWMLTDVYDDGGLQGDDPGRPEFNRMLADAADFDVLIVRDLDRFSRKLAIYATAVDSLHAAGVTLYEFQGASGLKRLDLDDESERAMAGMKAVFAEMEKAKIKRRVRQAKRARAEAGGHPGGKRPYGYCFADGDHGDLIPDPTESAVVVRMFQMADAGTSQRQIARVLNAEGLPSSRGGRWVPSSVNRILHSPLYLGKLPRKTGTVQGKHKPILDEALWERVNRSRATPERRAGGRPLQTGHLLTRGLLRCGACGSAMMPVPAYGKRHERYECLGHRDHGAEFCQHTSVRRSLIDGALRTELTNRYLDWDGARDRLRAQIAQEVPLAQAAVEEAVTDLSRAESRLAKVTRGWQDEVIPDDEYRRQRAELDAEREAARAAVEQAERRLADVEARGLTTDDEEALLRHLADLKRLVSGSVEDAPNIEAQRTVIRQLFRQVILTRRSWDTVDEIEAYGVDAGEGLYLLPALRDGVADWTGFPDVRINRVAVPGELATPTCRAGHFSDVLFAPIPVAAGAGYRF